MLKRTMYVIMDKKRLFIVQFGSDKYKTKYLTHVDQKDTDNNKLVLRVFFYDTIGRAQSGIKSNFMWLNDMIHYYPEIQEEANSLKNTQKESKQNFINKKLLEQLEIVKVEMVINEIK